MNDSKGQQVPVENFVQIKCVQCENAMGVRMPTPRIFNAIDVSIVAFSHQDITECPNCHALYSVVVLGLNEKGELLFKWVRVKKQGISDLVEGSDQNIEQALIAQQLAASMKKGQN